MPAGPRRPAASPHSATSNRILQLTRQILVTGAAGFIGSHCCESLLDRGWRVVGVDNFDPFYARATKEASLAALTARNGFAFAEDDIRDAGAMTRLVDGCDTVLHLAALAGVRASIEAPERFASVNVLGTATLLEACRVAGVRRVVFGSSSSVYGDTTPAPFREDAPATDPISPYAASKRAGELLCRVYAHLHGFRIAALRFFTVYGARQRPDLAIHRFTRLLSERRTVQQYGDGSTERDYTHIDDILLGVHGALAWVADGEPALEVVNLGESQTVRLDRLIALISQALGVSPNVEVQGPAPGDVRHTCADISKARRLFGYNPVVNIESGVQRFVDWYRTVPRPRD